MALVSKSVRGLADFLNYVSAWCLIGMTALTCADVVMRIFNRPIIGTYEMVGFLGAAVASLAMAHTTVHRGHVAVEVLTQVLPQSVQKVIYLITNLLSILLFVFLAYECWRFGADLSASHEVSLTLQIPFAPILYGMSVSSMVVCLVLLVDFFKVITGAAEPWSQWQD